MEYEKNETVNFHRLERSMYDSVPIFQSVVEAEQQNGGNHQNHPLAENKNTSSVLNK